MNVDVKRILTKIHNASEQGSLSFFVGAGVSKLSGQPSWSELLNNIKSICDEVVKQHYAKRDIPISNIIDSVIVSRKNCNAEVSKCNIKRRNVPSKDNYARAQILFDALELEHSEDKFNDIVKFCFNDTAEENDIHDKIVSLNPSSIITTNFDNLIEKACKRKAEKFVTVASDDEVSSIQGQRFILKIHGDFEHKNIVFTEDSYLNYERQFPLLSRMLTSILATNTVVFIGYSLSDFNIRLLVNLLKPLYQKIAKDKLSIKSKKFLANLDNDTRPIFYNVGEKRLSNEDKKYLLNKGIEALDCRDLYKNLDPKNYKLQYNLLFSYLQSLDKIDTASLDKTHELYKSFVRYESFNAVTTDMLLETSSEYVTGIYKWNSVVSRVCFNNCSTYKRYLYKSIKISKQSKKECDFITKIFLKAGIRKFLVDFSKKIVDLLDLIGNKEIHHKQSQIQQFYTDCISFDYKKLEFYSKRKNIDYRLKNYALYKYEKYDELLKEIESNSNQLYSKTNKEIEFIILKLNYDYINNLLTRKAKFAKFLKYNQLNKSIKLSEILYDKSLIKREHASDSFLIKGTEENKQEDKHGDTNNNAKISVLDVNLDKIFLSRLLDKMPLSSRQKYSFLTASPDFPISNGDLNTIQKAYQNLIRNKLTVWSMSSAASRKILQSIIDIQRYLVLNGIFKDKADSFHNIVSDILCSTIPMFAFKKGQNFDGSYEPDKVEFNNELFFLMIEHCASISLLESFRYQNISNLYCGQRNERINSIENSINNLLNYAKKFILDYRKNDKKHTDVFFSTSIYLPISRLIVISSYLKLSFITSYNLVKFILDNFKSLSLCCPEEILLFFSSILNESHKDDVKLKLLLTKWLKESLVVYMNELQQNIDKGKDINYEILINTVLPFLHKFSSIKWLDPIYLSIFRQKNTQLYSFASLILCWYVSKESLEKSINMAHAILDENEKLDLDLAFLIIKRNGNLSNKEIDKLKKYLNGLIEEYKKEQSLGTIAYRDPLESVCLIGYFSTFGKLSRVFDEFLGYSHLFDFLYLYKDFDFSKFNCDWLLYESDTELDNYFSDSSVKQKILKALSVKLKDPYLSQNDKSKYMDIFLKYFTDD